MFEVCEVTGSENWELKQAREGEIEETDSTMIIRETGVVEIHRKKRNKGKRKLISITYSHASFFPFRAQVCSWKGE